MKRNFKGPGFSRTFATGALAAIALAAPAVAGEMPGGSYGEPPGGGYTVVQPASAPQAGPGDDRFVLLELYQPDRDLATGDPWVVMLPDGDQFVLQELYQPDRDLLNGDPYVNLLVDTEGGRSWILRYGTFPGSNERGYVWVEVPFSGEPPREK